MNRGCSTSTHEQFTALTPELADELVTTSASTTTTTITEVTVQAGEGRRTW